MLIPIAVLDLASGVVNLNYSFFTILGLGIIAVMLRSPVQAMLCSSVREGWQNPTIGKVCN